MSGSLSIGGLISGIDTNTLLDQLYEVAQAPIRRLESRKQGLNQKSAAWSQFEALALTFRGLAVQLATPTGFRLYSATVSHGELVSASLGSNATPGTYTFTIQALAQTHQLVAQGYADTDETSVGTGTVTIAVGEGDPVVVDVDGFTLAELRDAINKAEAGVNAAIINDGSATSPYRLVLTSKTSGLDGEMAVTVDLAGGTAPSFSEMEAAQDAQVQLGSGAGAVTISSGSNTISGAIEGVTLNLLAVDAATPVMLTVSRDTAAVQGRIEAFVAAYNEAVDFFAAQFDFDPDTGWAGVLFGDYRLEGLQHDLARSVGNAIVGAMGGFASLSQIGIRVEANGRLMVESSTLASALSGSFDDVVGVFAARGAATHDDVTYLTGTSETQPSGAAGWAVEITQAATQSRMTASVAQTAALAADETLTINGVNVSLS
ncbi:MAG TPA: flagellar filament capping protein FliD, partial [Thermoleophilia bacterium]|nr:flagellar filament capping protein FliD [Thermoleophilia bacterium]